MLTKNQKQNIRGGRGHQEIDIDIKKLYQKVIQDFPIKKGDLKDSLDFLVEGNLAQKNIDEEIDYLLKYRKLRSTRDIQTKQKKEGKRQKLKELSKKFINHYIKYHTGEKPEKKEKSKKKELENKSILDF